MSKLNNRDAVKNLSALNVDCQYVYQIGLQVFNYAGTNPDEFKELCANFRNVTDDIATELEAIRKLIPNE